MLPYEPLLPWTIHIKDESRHVGGIGRELDIPNTTRMGFNLEGVYAQLLRVTSA